MKKIKNVEDVVQVPADQFIETVNKDGDEWTCAFCARKLPSTIVGIGRDKCVQYYDCSCEVAQAAEAHNKICRIIKG